jgi:hypothetical protein
MTPKMTPHSYVTERGLFARVAKKLKLDASYVSRVANGERQNERISQAIEAALDKICNARRKGISRSLKAAAKAG